MRFMEHQDRYRVSSVTPDIPARTSSSDDGVADRGYISPRSQYSGEAASMLVHPFGRVRFEKLNGLGQRNSWRKVKKNMRVVRHAVDSNRGHFLVAADASQIGPEFRLDIFGDGRLTVFCAEDKMDMIPDERVRHGLCRPFRALILILLTYPTDYAVGSIISPFGLLGIDGTAGTSLIQTHRRGASLRQSGRGSFAINGMSKLMLCYVWNAF
jgi:hypothetical protein